MANEMKKKKGLSRIFPENKLYTVLILIMALVAIAFLAMIAVVNAFPANMTMGLVAALFAVLLLAWVLLARRQRPLRVLGLLVALLFLTFYGLGTYYLGTTYAMFARISNNEAPVKASEGLDPTQDSFNVYITGIDQWNKEKGLDLERSDVNMIVTVCPQTRKILLTSIPRDAYVELDRVPEMDKLTHTGIYGVDETLKTVEKWLGIDLNYYVKMNFSAVRDVINAMGGVDVYSPVAFGSSISDYTYEKGWNHLDGKAALYFARERKSFEGKDSLRVENQQILVKALIDKLTSSTTLLTKYGDILGAAGKSLETNMSNDDMQNLVKMQLADLSPWTVESQKIEGEYDLDYVASLAKTSRYQVYKTYPESVASCVDAINAVMNPTQAELDEVLENKKKTTAINFIKGILGRNNSASEGEGSETEETQDGE
jgi:LCP family protein required for cell wall assembly